MSVHADSVGVCVCVPVCVCGMPICTVCVCIEASASRRLRMPRCTRTRIGGSICGLDGCTHLDSIAIYLSIEIYICLCMDIHL
jgi:hypothetical protein